MHSCFIKKRIYILLCGLVWFTTSYSHAHQVDVCIPQLRDQPKPITQEPAAYQRTCTKTHDLLHTQLAVRFDWKKQCLHGVATLQLCPHYYPQLYLVLDANQFTLHRVARIEEGEQKELAYTYDGSKLSIDLGRPFAQGEEYEIEIAYTTQAHTGPTGTAATLEDNNRGLFFVNPDDPTQPQQIWTLGQPHANSYWFPTIDAPNQRCTQEIYITVDDKFKTLSNGTLGYSILNEDLTRTDYWHLDLPHAPYLFMLAVGEFAEVQDTWNGMAVNYYVEPAYAPYAKAIFGRTPEMLEFFSKQLDYAYPWPKYSQVVVRDCFVGAMENTSAVVFHEGFQMDERMLVDRLSYCEDVIAHELFHHWFGNLVTCESWSHVSLNESFACLGSLLWRIHRYGEEAGSLFLVGVRNRYLGKANCKPESLIRFHYNNVIDLFQDAYTKGTLVLYMLKHYIGEAAFFDALRYYLKKHAFSSVEIHQFRKAVEEVVGEDLNWFFNQWFLAPGHPRLKVTHTYAGQTLTLKITQQQVEQGLMCYRLPLTVTIWTKGGQQHHAVVVEEAYQEFTWTLSQEPDLVKLDQQGLLVGEIEHAQTTAAYGYLYNQSRHFFDKQEALTYCSTAVEDPTCCQVLLDALQDAFWFCRKKAIQAFTGYQGPAFSKVEEQLIALSKADPIPAVRRAALQTLASFPDPTPYVSLYKEALQAPSYALMCTALRAYIDHSTDSDKADCVAALEVYNDPAISLVLGRYYIATQQAGKWQFFQDKLTQLQRTPVVGEWIQLLAQYLASSVDPVIQKKGLQVLRHLAQSTRQVAVKKAIYEALQPLHKLKGAKGLLQELKKEKGVSRR